MKASAMLTKSWIAASLLALAPVASAQLSQPAQGHQVKPDGFVPYGDFSGAWISGSLLFDGVLSGVLTDALGRPLWILDTTLSDTGKVQGSLAALEYSTNPALGFSSLSVMGQAQIGAQGSGSFSLIIYEPNLQATSPEPVSAAGYVKVLGTLSGNLQSGRLDAPAPLGSGPAGGVKPLRVRQADDSSVSIREGSGTSSATAQLPGVIVCPKGPDQPGIGSVGQGNAMGAAGGAATGSTILCPHAPGISLDGISQHGAGQGADGSPSVSPAQGKPGQAGHQVPNSGSGKANGRWQMEL